MDRLVIDVHPPKGEPSRFSIITYPQAYPQAVQGVGADQSGHKWSPPCVKYDGGVIHTPTQKIYAKVRSP
jgi:hypothetical protein